MPFVSGGHLWLILILLVIVLIVWGPGKLPDVGAGMGRAIREFKKASADTKEHFANAVGGDEATPAPSPTNATTTTTVATPPAITAPAPADPVKPAEEPRPQVASVPEEHRVSS